MENDDTQMDEFTRSRDILGRLAAHPDPGVRERVAGNPNAAQGTLHGLRFDSDDAVRARLAHNPNTASATRLALLRGDSHEVAAALASSPCTPASVLMELLKRRELQTFVAANPNLPTPIVDALATGEAVVDSETGEPITIDGDCVGYAWTNRSVSQALLHGCYDQRIVALNPATSPEMLDMIFYESGASSWVERRESEAGDPYAADCANSLALMEATPTHVLDELADCGDVAVRAMVAGNPRTPPQTIEQVAAPLAAPEILLGAATNPSASPELLDRLSSNWWTPPVDLCVEGEMGAESGRYGRPWPPGRFSDLSLRQVVAVNHSAAPDTLRSLASLGVDDVTVYVAANPATPECLLRELSEHPNPMIVANVARNPSSPSDVVGNLAESETTTIRAGAAGNPNIAGDVLGQLAQDRSASVLEAVAANHRYLAEPPLTRDAVMAVSAGMTL